MSPRKKLVNDSDSDSDSPHRRPPRPPPRQSKAHKLLNYSDSDSERAFKSPLPLKKRAKVYVSDSDSDSGSGGYSTTLDENGLLVRCINDSVVSEHLEVPVPVPQRNIDDIPDCEFYNAHHSLQRRGRVAVVLQDAKEKEAKRSKGFKGLWEYTAQGVPTEQGYRVLNRFSNELMEECRQLDLLQPVEPKVRHCFHLLWASEIGSFLHVAVDDDAPPPPSSPPLHNTSFVPARLPSPIDLTVPEFSAQRRRRLGLEEPQAQDTESLVEVDKGEDWPPSPISGSPVQDRDQVTYRY